MKTIGTLAVVGFVGVAHGSIFSFGATIDGIQSGSGSPATGNLVGEYDDVANTFSFSWSITDELIGTPASPGSHLHRAPAGSNGPIVFAFNNPDGTWALNGTAVWSGISDPDVATLFAGGFYANFHTTEFPTGEVRGQVLLVPAPSGLASLGFGALFLHRRRR